MEHKNNNKKDQREIQSDSVEIVQILKQQSKSLARIEKNLKTNGTFTTANNDDDESPSSETTLDLSSLRPCFDSEESHKEFCQNIKSIIESSESSEKFEGLLNMLKMILAATLPEGEAEKYVKMLDLTSKAIGGSSKLNLVNSKIIKKWFRSTSNKENKEENEK